ncbi:hypothetical protein E2C01_056748 [Portunus trituberculatus]|uniref:Uncharacterized protein n=1 Tax=Portunus trituberculatus TaxID=210409 RepID=A0A5B7GYL8_PORTR|nr:hypothetical protein [Portunus trituberculatus]
MQMRGGDSKKSCTRNKHDKALYETQPKIAAPHSSLPPATGREGQVLLHTATLLPDSQKFPRV